MSGQVIQTTQELHDFLQDIQSGFVALDTEFIRERTYWPQVCLIQLATAKSVAAIDPLKPQIDLKPLWTFLQKKDVLKVFHAARQDLEGFYALAGFLPTPFFDTQVASMACAFGDNISYENLVDKLLGQPIDKSERVIDWSRRPLSEKQVSYALDDVIYLRALYPLIRQRLREWGRESWIREEMHVLTDPKTYEPDFLNAWKKVKGWASIPNLTPRGFAFLQRIATWREKTAAQDNIPRRQVLRDDFLCAAIHAFQKKPETPLPLPCSQPFDSWKKEVQLLPASDLPHLPQAREVPEKDRQLYRSLSTLLKECATKAAVAPRLIGTRQDLEQLMQGKPQSPLLRGWRYDVFGSKALEIIQGSSS